MRFLLNFGRENRYESRKRIFFFRINGCIFGIVFGVKWISIGNFTQPYSFKPYSCVILLSISERNELSFSMCLFFVKLCSNLFFSFYAWLSVFWTSIFQVKLIEVWNNQKPKRKRATKVLCKTQHQRQKMSFLVTVRPLEVCGSKYRRNWQILCLGVLFCFSATLILVSPSASYWKWLLTNLVNIPGMGFFSSDKFRLFN